MIEVHPPRPQIDVHQLQDQLRRSRRRTWVVLVVEVAMTVIGAVIGVGCALIAWQWRDVFFGAAALLLLLVCPLSAVGLYRLRRRSLDWADRTPAGTVRYALTRLRLARRTLRMQYWGAILLLLLAALLWVGALTGLISRFYPLRTISAVWICAALATIAWSQWGLRRNERQYSRCERLLSQVAEVPHPLPGELELR